MRCYNAAHSYQLGWYDEAYDSVDETTILTQEKKEYILNGVVDYKENKNGIVSLRIEGPGDIDWYIGYNRGTGFNSETGKPDKVHILYKRRGQYSWTKRKATLGVKDSLTWKVGRSAITAKFKKILNSRDAIVSIKAEK